MSDSTTRQSSTKFCECGCGQPLKHPKYPSEQRRFISGHNARKIFGVEPSNPSGLCMCGCGQKTAIATYTNRGQGYIKGQPLSYIPGHHARKAPLAPDGYKGCSICKQIKPLNEFYLVDKNQPDGKRMVHCKLCNAEKVKEIKGWLTESTRKRVRQWSKRNPERVRAHEKKRDPEKIRARRAVQRLVRSGDFPPANTMVCEHCQEALGAEYHHHRGYSEKNRLDVICLCRECHVELDKKALP